MKSQVITNEIALIATVGEAMKNTLGVSAVI